MIDVMHAHPLARSCGLAWALAGCTTTPIDDPAEAESGSTSSATTDAPITSGPGVTSTSGPPVTTGADTSSSGTSASGSSDDGMTFISAPDGCFSGSPELGWSSHCSTFECDVSVQDCPRGEKCMPWANDGSDVWNSGRCSPLDDDPVPPGGSCTVEGSAVSGIDSCELGAMCWEGTCIGFCDPLRVPSRICVEPALCLNLNFGYVPVCVTPCDPLQDAPCPDGEACRHLQGDDGFYCLPLLGGHVYGSSQHCEDATCLPSQLCLPADSLSTCEAASCCTELCDLGDPGADAQCAAIDPVLACEPFYAPGAAPAGLELVGACTVPM
jgi:hypothetical protein